MKNNSKLICYFSMLNSHMNIPNDMMFSIMITAMFWAEMEVNVLKNAEMNLHE